MNPLLIASTLALLSVVPSGDTVVFHKNELELTFNEPVLTHSIKVTDHNDCTVSKGATVDGPKIVVQLEACERIGFPAGHMHVEWTVNGVSSEIHMHVRKHH